MSAVNLLKFDQNDHGNAERIEALYGKDLIYSKGETDWRVWDATRWSLDQSAAYRLATSTLQLYKKKADLKEVYKGHANGSLNHGKVLAALNALANFKGEPLEVFDSKKTNHLLNFKNGTIDLKTGEFKAHDREDLITRLVHYDYSPLATTPHFSRFLNQIMEGNQEMISYLQRALGYSLTGETCERAFFVAYGTGTNGKSTLLDLIRKLFREYSTKIMIDSLIQKKDGASLTAKADLADLRGARFASTSEGEEGQHFGAALKQLAQGNGGVIKTSQKYKNPIEFPETHTTWMDTNHPPSLPTNDDALWNRVHPIHFGVTIPKDQIDLSLHDKLLEEAPGIIAWVVEGAWKWYSEGKLVAPESVVRDRKAWRDREESQDRPMPLKPGFEFPSKKEVPMYEVQ